MLPKYNLLHPFLTGDRNRKYHIQAYTLFPRSFERLQVELASLRVVENPSPILDVASEISTGIQALKEPLQ